MDFIDACKVVLRRWYVVVPLLLLTFAGTYFAYSSASANYSAKGALAIVPPVAAVGPDGSSGVCLTNTWCTGGDVLNLANVTARKMDDPGISKQVLDPFPGATYEVVLNSDNRSSIMEMSATARTPKEALDALNAVSGEVKKQLLKVQTDSNAKVNEADIVTSDEVTMPDKATPQSGVKLRAAAAAFALGLAITLGGAFLAESIAVSRRANASLLDRIALPDQAAGAPPARTGKASGPAANPGPADETGAKNGGKRAPANPVAASSRRSGRVGP